MTGGSADILAAPQPLSRAQCGALCSSNKGTSNRRTLVPAAQPRLFFTAESGKFREWVRTGDQQVPSTGMCVVNKCPVAGAGKEMVSNAISQLLLTGSEHFCPTEAHFGLAAPHPALCCMGSAWDERCQEVWILPYLCPILNGMLFGCQCRRCLWAGSCHLAASPLPAELPPAQSWCRALLGMYLFVCMTPCSRQSWIYIQGISAVAYGRQARKWKNQLQRLQAVTYMVPPGVGSHRALPPSCPVITLFLPPCSSPEQHLAVCLIGFLRFLLFHPPAR